MPRLAKRRQNHRVSWTDEHRQALMDGCDFFNVFDEDARALHQSTAKTNYQDRSPAGEALRKQCWGELRDSILAEWIRAKPFTRPCGWWDYEAPARRECVSGLHPFDHPGQIAHNAAKELEYPGFTAWVTSFSHGTPRIHGGPGFDFHSPMRYETERQYLERLDLFTRYERELIAGEDSCPA